MFSGEGRNGKADIFSIRTNGTSLRRLTRSAEAESTPDYSPNGKKLLFVRELDEVRNVFKMNSDGTNERALTHLPKPALDPDWATNPGP